ncbi:radical SAM family heme chaperone HemW [Inediibacterium massiliense]|uniref:radical SAM family heme chaperone HemW n=1 Tax=Inediibacterium massiliense TaxID=1658111 RepID=UPI0006B5026C|nr:radical SAM family heme chaperone HemW [Inediibacterium massiliense]
MKNIGLYIHIPFCVKKCFYCDFCSYPDTHNISNYMNALKEEIKSFSEVLKDYQIKSIFIGGGTPSIIPIDEMDKIINLLHERFSIDKNVEWSIESNPGTLDEEKIRFYLKSGINRLSMGLQAWQNHHLKRLGRIHTKEEFVKNYLLARKLGFENINIDLMFSLPDQTLAQWEETLAQVVKLDPEHISSYSLKIEENTIFDELYKKDLLNIPNDEEDRKMYHFAIEYLTSFEYEHYEISNFAKANKGSMHNQIYWENKEYIGFGVGAHSYFKKERFSNETNVENYIDMIQNKKSPHITKEKIYKEDEMAETMFLGLRLMRGINIKEFEERFKISPLRVYGKSIEKFTKEELLWNDGRNIGLTKRGIDVSNQVFIDFLPD